MPSSSSTATVPTIARLATATACAGLALGLLSSVASADEREIERRHGSDRISTAVEASQAAGDDAAVALLTHSGVFPDGLVSGALAAHEDAPLLLTPTERLDGRTLDELERLAVDEVVVLGGSRVVSADVVDELEGAGFDVERRWGRDRYATAASIAGEVGASPDGEVLLALGEDGERAAGWPDAVAAASLTSAEDLPPTLLTTADVVPPQTLEALEGLGAQSVRLLGGEAAISSAVAEQLESDGYSVERTQGPSRYHTAARAADKALDRLDGDELRPVLASGESMADAVIGGATAARLGEPLAYAHPSRLIEPTDELLREHADRWSGALLIGGDQAVSDFSLEVLEAALNGRAAPEPPEPEEPDEPEEEAASTGSQAPWDDWAPRHGWDTWERLARCESDIDGTGPDWSINTGNGYYGGLQFHINSWRAVGGSGYPHQASREEQIYRGEKLQAVQGWGAWPACSSKLGLR